MQNNILVSFSELMAYRRAKNLELYCDNDPRGFATLFVETKVGNAIACQVNTDSAKGSTAEYDSVKNYANKAVVIYDKRVLSHDFSNPATWPVVDGSPSAHFEVVPPAGWKYILTSCLVRFPVDTVISPTNPFHFRVSLSMDGVSAPVPVITYNYASLADLIQKSNVPVHILGTIIPNAFTKEMVELEFRYADPNTLEGAPIVFRSSLGEKLELYFDDNAIPFKDGAGASLANACYIILNYRRTPEF